MLSLLNDASVDNIADEGSFQFSPESELTSPLYVHITLATDAETESPCFAQLYSVKNMLKLLTFTEEMLIGKRHFW